MNIHKVLGTVPGIYKHSLSISYKSIFKWMREVVVHGNNLAEQAYSENVVARIKDYLKGMGS